MIKTRVLFVCTLGFIFTAYGIFNIGSKEPVIYNEKQVSETAAESNDTVDETPPAMPQLLVKRSEDSEKSEPLELKSVKLNVTTVGNIAQTTMELVFYNDLDRDLEGEFFFPLADGQSVSGYALEINGVMRKGVVLEKQKARKVFEEVIRQGIDPGLAEWSKGNNFHTRIFPIPAKGTKRVSVTLDQELISEDSVFNYIMPMDFDTAVEQFGFNIKVIQQTQQPYFDDGTEQVEFQGRNESWTASLTKTNYLPDKGIKFSIPKVKGMPNVFVEKSEKYSGKYAFYYCTDPKKDSTNTKKTNEAAYEDSKKMPAKICILWDASGSALKRNINKEVRVIDAYLSKIGNVNVQVIPFNNTILPAKDFQISNGDVTELTSYLNNIFYDGGTQLGLLNLKKYLCDEFIFVSDGISSFGLSDVELATTPVIALSSSPQADYSVLKRIANETGGQYINMLKLSEEEVVGLISTPALHYLGYDVLSGNVNEVYPSMPVEVDKTFSLGGIIEGSQAEIMLNFGYGKEITHRQNIIIKNKGIETEGMVEHIWALKKLNELDVDFEKNKFPITQHGLKHGLVTRFTSLLVLDRIEDYVRHKIVPADPSQKKEYYALLKEKEAQEKEAAAEERKTKAQHMDQVVAQFNERIAWWNTDFHPETLKKLKKEKSKKTGDMVGSADMAMADSTTATTEEAAEEAPVEEEGSDLDLGQRNTAGYNNAVRFVSPGMAAAPPPPPPPGTDALERKADMKIANYEPETPYLKELKNASPADYNAVYRKLRAKNAKSAIFFLDVSNFFFKKGDKQKAITILSNLAELHPEDHCVLRVMAHKLEQEEVYNLSILTFKQLLEIRDEEPQSYRDLGLAYAGAKRYQEAINLLCKVVNGQWNGRFPGIEVIAATEINAIIAESGGGLKLDSLDKRLIKHMPVDVRVVINWDNDNCDMDLWVEDPLNETCMYNHNLTRAGGRISNDFTGGYGPEEFMVKKAIKGGYKIRVNYYGSRQTTVMGPTTVQAECYTNYGRKSQKKKTITLRLEERNDVFDIGELMFGS